MIWPVIPSSGIIFLPCVYHGQDHDCDTTRDHHDEPHFPNHTRDFPFKLMDEAIMVSITAVMEGVMPITAGNRRKTKGKENSEGTTASTTAVITPVIMTMA